MGRLAGWIFDAYQRPETWIYKITEGFVWALIAISTAIFLAELTAPDKFVAWSELLPKVDRVILGLFAVDVILRVLSFRPADLDLFRGSPLYRLRVNVLGRLRYCLSPLILIDILTLLSLVPALRGLRALRLLRLLSGVRFFRYSNPFMGMLRSFAENNLLYRGTFGMIFSVVVVGGVSLFLLEGGVQGVNKGVPTVAEGLWWALVTITTVGYGDVSPVTVPGKIIGSVVMIFGMFTLALFAGIVSTTLLGIMFRLREEQFRMSAHANHIVICGYEPGARLLLDAILQEFGESKGELLIFARGERHDNVPARFAWLSGDPTKESELDKIKLTHARAVLVVGSRTKSPQEADATTLLIVFTIRSHLRKQKRTEKRVKPLYLVAEILDSENVEHAHAAGADEAIETTRLGFSLMAHSMTVPGSGEIMASVASAGAHSVYIGRFPYKGELTFEELAKRIKKRHGVTVLGIQDLETRMVDLSPGDDRMVHKGCGVVYLAREEVLEK